MFEWCFTARYTTAGFGVTVAASIASLAGILGAGPFAIVLGIAAGMPVLVAGSPTLDGERYLATTTAGQRAQSAILTIAVAVLVGVGVAFLAGQFLGAPIPALLGAGTSVLGGQFAFFWRNQEFIDRDREE